MRLIDADKYKCGKVIDAILSEHNFPIIKEINVSDIPTAYDADKVVEHLKAVSYERYGNDGMGVELVVNLDDAIEIVRGDREPEPECEWKLENAEGNLYATGCENRQLISERKSP